MVSAGPVLSLREQAFGGLSRLIKRCAGTCLFGTGDALTREPLAWPGSLIPRVGLEEVGVGPGAKRRAPGSWNARQAGDFALARWLH